MLQGFVGVFDPQQIGVVQQPPDRRLADDGDGDAVVNALDAPDDVVDGGVWIPRVITAVEVGEDQSPVPRVDDVAARFDGANNGVVVEFVCLRIVITQISAHADGREPQSLRLAKMSGRNLAFEALPIALRAFSRS